MGTVHWPVHKSKEAVEKGCVGPINYCLLGCHVVMKDHVACLDL